MFEHDNLFLKVTKDETNAGYFASFIPYTTIISTLLPVPVHRTLMNDAKRNFSYQYETKHVKLSISNICFNEFSRQLFDSPPPCTIVR